MSLTKQEPASVTTQAVAPVTRKKLILNVSEIIETISIDCVIFGLNKGQLEILLVKHGEGIREGNWGVPGGWIKHKEDLEDAAYRLLHDLTGLENIYLEQFKAFGRANRYPVKRVVTIGYYALVKPEQYKIMAGFTASDVRWAKLSQCKGLIYDHDEIIVAGLEHLKSKVCRDPVGFNLLPTKFTLLQLQELYEAILGVKLDKPNFRRKMIKTGLLLPCDEKQKDVPHRAAALYRFNKKAIHQQLTL
jgi:8-oxo-dGTP diphosphatase